MFTDSASRRVPTEPNAHCSECDYFIWTGSLFRMPAVAQIGLPSADYVLDMGEIEYGYRARQLGLTGYVVQNGVTHQDVGRRPGVDREPRVEHRAMGVRVLRGIADPGLLRLPQPPVFLAASISTAARPRLRSHHGSRFGNPDQLRAPAGQPPSPVARQPARCLGWLDRAYGAPLLRPAEDASDRLMHQVTRVLPYNQMLLVARGRERVKRYSWREAAEATLAVCASLG